MDIAKMFTRDLQEYDLSISSGRVSFNSPSNIALIKYWGKFGVQLPMNPSLSVTLDQAHTKTEVSFTKKQKAGIEISFLFEGSENTLFAKKIETYFQSIVSYFPFLEEYKFNITSNNTFPHSSGIASSASSMSALAMCLCQIESQLLKQSPNKVTCLKKASFISRLGSGSACRSVFSKMSLWGECEIQGSSNYHAIEFLEFSDIFLGLRDSVVIVSKGEKAVSSRAGHALMNDHPFASTRFESARSNLVTLQSALSLGDFKKFTEIVEIEALELHGLMMNSRPSYILMEPNTLEVIKRIRNFREQTGALVCFTLDAGPNVHILYPKSQTEKVMKFINESIAPLAQDQLIIHDQMGEGPVQNQC